MKKPKVEYRITCPNFGTRGHSTHVHTHKTLAKAKEAVKGLDRHYEWIVKYEEGLEAMYSYSRSEIGWTVETRTVTEWELVT